MHRFSAFFLFFLFQIAITSCAPSSTDRIWVYDDLRLLDSLDAPTPSTEIIAVYNRMKGSDMQIRVDFLDISIVPDYDLYLALDTQPGGEKQFPLYSNPSLSQNSTMTVETDIQWDILLFLPADDQPQVYLTAQNPASVEIRPRLIRDPWLDTVIISMNRLAVSTPFNLQVFVTKPDGGLADQTIPIRSDNQPPSRRSPLLLAFRNTFPAATPAQALRSWDGAHTGPTGERHGLKHILDNAEQYSIPIVLLDLKNPASLAALNYLGAIEQLRRLSERSLLILPDVAYSAPADMSLNFSRRSAHGFNLAASQFVYNPAMDIQSGYQAQFLSLTNASHIASFGMRRFIPLSNLDWAVQATREGLSIEVRQSLMEVALSADPTDLVALGGYLPDSTWGDSDISAASFAWIGAHPWIQPLNSEDLMTFPSGKRYASPPPTNKATPSSPFLADLLNAPNNAITQSAWQTYLSLNTASDNEKLQALRSQYIGQVGTLLAASRWSEHPSAQLDCGNDLDYDGQVECILANSRFFTVIDPNGARLTHLFYVDESGPHQLVAPSSQFTVGLSDPSEWHLERGEASDPSVISGAFCDSTDTWMPYNATLGADSITFANIDSNRVKTFRLTTNGLEVLYQNANPLSTRIPLVMDPQSYFFSPTNYQAVLTPHSWRWGIFGGLSVEIRTQTALAAQGFTASFPFMSLPENPNLDYPEGHYFAYPLSVVSIWSEDSFRVEILIHR